MTERQDKARRLLAQLWSLYRYRIEHMAVLVEVSRAVSNAAERR